MSAMKNVAIIAQASGDTAQEAMQAEMPGDGAGVYAGLQVIVGYAAMLGYQGAPQEEEADDVSTPDE